MVCLPAELEPLPAESYRREARRLRALFPKDLHRLQNSLGRLAKREDARQRIRASVAAESSRRASVVCRVIPTSCETDGLAVDRFAAMVESEIQSGVLRNSQRAALLRQAKRLGISRFDASLIIASVQHRFSGSDSARVVSSNSANPFSRRFNAIGAILCVLAVEIPLAILAWKILHP